jgi:hypothetical protein
VAAAGLASLFGVASCGGSEGNDLFSSSSSSSSGGTDPDSGPPTDAGTAITCDADTSNDDGHCGSCANRCATGQHCQSGACVAGPAVLVPPQDAGGIQFGDTAQLVLFGGDVFFTTGRFNGGVYSVPKNGGGLTTIATNQGGPRGIAVDSQHVYWVNVGGGQVMRAARTPGAQPQPIAAGGAQPIAIAEDGNAIYFTTRGDGCIWSLSKTAPVPTGPTRIAGPDGPNQMNDLAVYNGTVYFTQDGTGLLKQVPVGGPPGAATSPIMGNVGSRGVAANAKGVAWAQPGGGAPSGRVLFWPFSGNTATPVATGQQLPWATALDANGEVYFARHIGPTGGVHRAVAGAAPIDIATNQSSPTAIAVDDTSVYWLNIGLGSLLRAAK